MGIGRNTITEIVEKFNVKVFDNDLKRGDKVEDIAKHNHADLATTWAILLQGKDDLERQLQDFLHFEVLQSLLLANAKDGDFYNL